MTWIQKGLKARRAETEEGRRKRKTKEKKKRNRWKEKMSEVKEGRGVKQMEHSFHSEKKNNKCTVASSYFSYSHKATEVTEGEHETNVSPYSRVPPPSTSP